MSYRSFKATRILYSVALAAMLVACQAGTATPNPSASQPPLLIDAGKLITWEVVPDEIAGVLVIQKLQNIGTSWIQVAPRDSTYEIKAPNGNVIANSNFRRAYPTYDVPRTRRDGVPHRRLPGRLRAHREHHQPDGQRAVP
jgi:hypothetical protein